VAVTSPLAKSSVRLVNPCEEYALSQKHRKYDSSFQGTEHLFCAMVWETLGSINVEGEEVLRQIFRFAAKRLGREFSSFCGRSWARFSCCLQRSVAQSILVRIDGREFRGRPRAATPEVPSVSGPVRALPSPVRVSALVSAAVSSKAPSGPVRSPPFVSVSSKVPSGPVRSPLPVPGSVCSSLPVREPPQIPPFPFFSSVPNVPHRAERVSERGEEREDVSFSVCACVSPTRQPHTR
jgi:hypothetical protein